MSEWFTLDKFWETMADKLFSPEQWENAEMETEQVLALTDSKPGSKVLDLCCGPGRHSLAFARRGFPVTGVDLTERYLEQARNKAEAEKLEISFIREDMREYRKPDAYDLVLNLFTSFGYFPEIADDKKVMANICSNLKKGGQVVIELMGKEVLARIFRARDWYEQDGVLFIEERKICRNWSWIENRWIRIEGSDRQEFNFSHRLYAATELESLLMDTGFSRVSCYGALDGIPYDNRAKRLVMVGEK